MLLGQCLLCSAGISFWERGVGGEHRGAPGPLLGKAPACQSVAPVAWVGRTVGFCSCSTGLHNPAVRAARGCECVWERGGKNPLSAETWVFYIPCFIFWRPRQYLFHRCWCLQKALRSLAMPWLLPTVLALRLRCRQRLLLCRGRAPWHQHAPSPSPLGPFGGRAQKALLLSRRGVAEGDRWPHWGTISPP